MKNLVIYDSKFGNTEKIAKAIAQSLEAEAVSIEGKPDFRDAEFLVVGSPIHGWRPSENMIAFLEKLTPSQLKGMRATSFDTRVKLFIHGDAANKIAKALKNAGAEIVESPQPFYVQGSEGPLFDGETEKAKIWGSKLGKLVN